MKPRDRIVLSLDFSDVDLALELVERTRSHVGMFKVGLPLIARSGFSVLGRLRQERVEVFLDLKFHDVPSAVETAVRESARYCARMVTVHALAGTAVIRAALRSLSEMTLIPGEPLPQIIAVTLTPNLDRTQLEELGLGDDPVAVAVRLAQLALAAGADGVLCAPTDARAIREACGPDCTIVCSGIRSSAMPSGELVRVGTAAEAIRAGADHVIVGRSVRVASDPAAEVCKIIEEITHA